LLLLLLLAMLYTLVGNPKGKALSMFVCAFQEHRNNFNHGTVMSWHTKQD